MKSIFNGKILDDRDILISPLSKGFSYGEGFFTTIKVTQDEPENIELHIDRIARSLDYFSFNIEEINIRELISDILKANSLSNARVKITYFQDTDRISYLITCNKLNMPKTSDKLIISDRIRGNEDIYRYKSLNYYSNLKSFYTVFKDHKDRLLETGFANIFIIQKNNIYTPPQALPILPGTYRQMLLNKKTVMGMNIQEKEICIEDIKNCDEIFLTNSIRGIIPIKTIMSRSLNTNKASEIKRLLDPVTN